MPKIPVRKKRQKKLTAVGITCGIGSMLVGAKQAGFRVVGNVEWRKYYHARDAEGRNTFKENFRSAFMKKNLDELDEEKMAAATGCDLAMGHPECGNFSQLNRNFRKSMGDAADIPLFVDLVARLQPRFFAMDDLPRSMEAFSMAKYHEGLSEYDLFPEWVSNYHYGNTQKNRRRMFMIGSLREYRWVFVPGEFSHATTVRNVLENLPTPGSNGTMANHEKHVLDAPAGRASSLVTLGRGVRGTWRQLREFFRGIKSGGVIEYVAADGSVKRRPGNSKSYWEKHAHVLDGSSCQAHALRCLPYTIRERARLQGFPDNFVFYGTTVDGRGQWNHDANVHLLKQTGKAMPIQFNLYLARQVRARLLERPFKATGQRMVHSNEYVDAAKLWYCREVGYSDQEAACSACWLRDRCNVYHGTDLPATRSAPVKKRPLPAPASPKKKKDQLVKTTRVRVVNTRVLDLRKSGQQYQNIRVEPVNVVLKRVPKGYHCRCSYCLQAIGELRRPDGSYYSRLERRRYYDPSESSVGGHIAKTPLHVARWAVQEYTESGDWVMDPTAGSGTTLVEALVQGRNAVGMELEFGKVLQINVLRFVGGKKRAVLGLGDARNIRGFLSGVRKRYQLVVNNPPYSGDKTGAMEGNPRKGTYQYNEKLPNLAFLKENDAYWKTMTAIYSACTRYLLPGGRFVVAVKDQMRSKKPDMIHQGFAEVLESVGLEHEGTAFLKHHPTTLHLNTYFKRYGIHPPYYQTILVFKKTGR